MSLLERFIPVVSRNVNYFDPFRSHMENEFMSIERQMMQLRNLMDKELSQMRKQMYQVLPYEPANEAQALAELNPAAPIVEENGETKLKLDFNVKGFKPEEVQVKVVGDNVLQVRAETGTKTDSGVSHRYYVRHYALPDGIKVDQIKPTMSKEGVLSIEAPAPHLKPTEKNIPIKYIEK